MKKLTPLNKPADQDHNSGINTKANALVFLLFLIFVITLILMFAFQYIKHLIWPHMSIWQSHLITNIVFTFLITFASYFILRSQNLLYKSAVRKKETFERKATEKARELLEAQKELEKAKRLSDIGALAATVAHELRNPLAAIKIASHNIKRKAENPNLDKHLSNIEKKITESDQIINNLLFYSRIKAPQYENTNIYEVIEECVSFLEEQSRNGILVEKRLEPIKDIFIEADILQMKELFANIISNATDSFISHQGKIEIAGESPDKDLIKVCIKDYGCGIDKNDLKRIYEPFFSTKAKGTGLGLTVCFQIVHLHNGNINIESEKGTGTAVTVTLPIKRGENA